MALTILIGGARAGKSEIAIARAKSWWGPVVFVATAEGRDEEMTRRIARHKESRPATWETVEIRGELDAALSNVPSGAFVIVDCLTLWVSGLMEQELSEADIEERARVSASIAAARTVPTVVVTNDVGSGIVPDNQLARRFRDLLGTVNKIWADEATEVLLVVAGRALRLDDEHE
jgi:adenosyl cobinamide kinase/adenosyl cobinamide phosphate guanylyltransferase